MEIKNTSGLKVLLLIAFIIMITVNALANLLPINGVTTGAVSDSYPNLFAPAGITFSIWGLIYLLLAAHTLYQLGLFRGKGKKTNSTLLYKVGIAFAISSLVNTAWIFLWHYYIIPLSMLLMAILLVCLIYINKTIKTYSLSLKEKFFIRLPFSIYFGWITVATIANATTLLVSLGWDGFGLPESMWAVIMVVIGMLIGAVTTIRFDDIAYGMVLVWAYIGILIKHTSASGFAGQYKDVIIAASVSIVLLLATVVYTLFRRCKVK